jgi:hypothetical protein
MKPVRVDCPNADNDANVVSLGAWADPSQRFGQLCDDATVLLAASERNEPALCSIAAELTSTLKDLASIDKPAARTRRALGVLTSVASHTEAEVFSAIDWIKRLGSFRQHPTATATATHRRKRSRRSKRINHDQQQLWSDQ